MTTTAAHGSFGRYLQSARIERGISLDQVAAETRIRKETLILIENEDYSHLPDDVFVKGFLRAYAKVVGADPAEAIHRYVSRREIFDAVSGPEDVSHHKVSKLWVRLAAALLGIAAIIAGSIGVLNIVQFKPAAPPVHQAAEDPPPVPSVPVAAAETPGLSTAPTAVEEPAAPPVAEQPPENPARRSLRIEAVEKTWLKIIIDEQVPKEYILQAGDHLAFDAKNRYNLLIGNASGIRMQFDSQEVAIPGKRGDVVSLRLPLE